MSELIKFERQKNENFTTISNEVLRDNRLSLKAKGFLVTVMGLPPDWDFSVTGMVSILKEGETAIYAALNELESFGYVARQQIRENGKFKGQTYVFKESPSPYRGFPDAVFPDAVLPDAENQGQLKKQVNKDTSNQSNTHNKADSIFLENPEQCEAMTIYRTHFPETHLSCFNQDQIEQQVKDLAKWEETLKFWKGNQYRATSIANILNCYQRSLTQPLSNGFNSKSAAAAKGQRPEPPRGLTPAERRLREWEERRRFALSEGVPFNEPMPEDTTANAR